MKKGKIIHSCCPSGVGVGTIFRDIVIYVGEIVIILVNNRVSISLFLASEYFVVSIYSCIRGMFCNNPGPGPRPGPGLDNCYLIC